MIPDGPCFMPNRWPISWAMTYPRTMETDWPPLSAAQFQEILDHRGWAPLDNVYPLAQLGLARAAALTGDLAKSRKAYQDFFALWKDADADLPVLLEARREYEKLRALN